MQAFIQSQDTPQRFSFVAPQFVITPLPDHRFMLIVSGVVITNVLCGQAKGWRRDTLSIQPDNDIRAAISRVAPQDGKAYEFSAEQWATYGSLNSVFDKDASVNAGFAVDSFSPIFVSGNVFAGIQLDVAVQDRDAVLLRVGYHATVVGTLSLIPPIL